MTCDAKGRASARPFVFYSKEAIVILSRPKGRRRISARAQPRSNGVCTRTDHCAAAPSHHHQRQLGLLTFNCPTWTALPDVQDRMPQNIAGAKHTDQYHSRPKNQPEKRPGQLLLVVSRFDG